MDKQDFRFAEPGLKDSVKQQRLSFKQVCGDKDQLVDCSNGQRYSASSHTSRC